MNSRTDCLLLTFGIVTKNYEIPSAIKAILAGTGFLLLLPRMALIAVLIQNTLIRVCSVYTKPYHDLDALLKEGSYVMTRNEKWAELADKVGELFRSSLGKFRIEDFAAVSDLLGFHAYKKTGTGERLKLIAENVLSDIIGTNLNYALEAYEWQTHTPLTEDGTIVSGF